jgi:hypothetical protein
MRAPRHLVFVALVALAGCGDWNEQRAEFDDYDEYRNSEFARRGYLPEDLVPRSARNIRAKYNIDSTAAEAEFDFAPADHDALIRPFLSFDQLSLRMAVQVGIAPPSALPSPSLLLRCGPGPMEFLRIQPAGHARYWTETDPKLRARSCTNNAAARTR